MKIILLESDNDGGHHISTNEGNFYAVCNEYPVLMYNEHPADGGVLVQELKTDVLEAVRKYSLKEHLDEDQIGLSTFLQEVLL